MPLQDRNFQIKDAFVRCLNICGTYNIQVTGADWILVSVCFHINIYIVLIKLRNILSGETYLESVWVINGECGK